MSETSTEKREGVAKIRSWRVIVGFSLQAFAVVMAFIMIDPLFEEGEILFYLFIQLTFVIPVWFLGTGVRNGFHNLKQRLWYHTRIFFYLALFLPFSIGGFMWLFDLQENTLNRGDELYMMLYANDSFMWLIVILFIVFIISVAPLMSGEGIKQKRVLIPFFTSLLMLPLLIFISWDHVRVIDHDGVSIVSFAERQEATWQEVDHVVVEPFIRRNPGTTNVPPSRTALFAIHVVEQSGDVYTFDNFGFNNDKMSQALEVRSHVVGKGIPFFVQQPTEDQWSFMIIELENEDVDERKFQQLFTPDPQ